MQGHKCYAKTLFNLLEQSLPFYKMKKIKDKLLLGQVDPLLRINDLHWLMTSAHGHGHGGGHWGGTEGQGRRKAVPTYADKDKIHWAVVHGTA